MLQTAKRILVTALGVAALAAPPAACARANLDVIPQQAHTATGELPQAGYAQARANGFDWADAGIGAAASALLLGGGGIAVARRRSARGIVLG